MPVSRKEFLKIQATVKCGFNLKRIRGMSRIYSQVQYTDTYLKRSSVIWLFWLNDWVFLYKLCGFEFESSCSHLIHEGAEKKLNDYTQVINNLSEKVKLIWTKVLIKDLINGYSILNSAKSFSKDGSRNCLLFQPAFKYFKPVTKIWLWPAYLKVYKMKVWNLLVNQVIFLIRDWIILIILNFESSV